MIPWMCKFVIKAGQHNISLQYFLGFSSYIYIIELIFRTIQRLPTYLASVVM